MRSSTVIGTILAVILSWTANKSVLWVILHGTCGWFYVAYHLILNKEKL